MRKTAGEIETDIYNLVSNSTIKNFIGGTIYREGMRPFDSIEEDAVITVLAGTSEEIQTGYVNVNVYVPDIFNNEPVKNISRCIAIEKHLRDFIRSNTLSNEYLFEADSIIKTFKEEEINQHFVNLKIKFKRTTF